MGAQIEKSSKGGTKAPSKAHEEGLTNIMVDVPKTEEQFRRFAADQKIAEPGEGR